ncbi:DUF421 domain-containing protein [Paenibacillus senegalensis]|uniref:DUF421 domain-containing protein n=1 Tax=Paenibacillus senegalensis TaxID=1465766 RepID=UPI0005AA82F5|nr:DUF421 domain-containing protein [Paenibacillus senegalensis]
MLFVLTRILGKRQISQLTFFEYITGIALGDLAGTLSTDLEANYLHGVASLLVWFALPFGMELLTLKSIRLRRLLDGQSTALIQEGKILEDNLKKERFTADELLEQLRTKSIFRVADVEFATLEPNGELSVLLKEEHQPLTPKHMGIQVPPANNPQTVIIDGEILDEPLSKIGLNRGWLHTELEKQGVAQQNVFLAQVDNMKQLYVDVYSDELKIPTPQNKELLHALLKKCQADLELFALQCTQAEAKEMYTDAAGSIQRVLDSITYLLKR